MRPFLLAGLLLAALLAGCTGDKDPAPATPEAALPTTPASGADGALPRLRFDAPAFEQVATYEGTFPNPDPCWLGATCPPTRLSYDLTALVPPDAPVELAITIDSDDCTFADFVLESTTIYRSVEEPGSIAALLVRAPEGTLGLEVLHCSLAGGQAGTPETPVTVEVRTAVRADVVPAYMPVFVALAPGDRIQAMGEGASDIDDLVVVPPGHDPIHLTTGPTFNVTADLPAGEYLVMVKGGDGMLHGPNTTLRPARLERFVGEDRAIDSGQPLSWTASVPGVPAFATLYVMTGTAGGLDNTRVSYSGAHSMSILQGGVPLAHAEQDSCVTPCSINGPGGQATDVIGTGLFPEGLKPGEVEFQVTNDLSQNMHAHEVVGYIVPA